MAAHYCEVDKRAIDHIATARTRPYAWLMLSITNVNKGENRVMSYDDNVKKWKKAYKEVLVVCDKYQDFDNLYSFRDIDDARRSAEDHLKLIEWYEDYGLKINHDHRPYSYSHINLGDYIGFSYYKDAKQEKLNGSGRFISWPDDNRQPKDEWLFFIGFSTGAYIFGEDYDSQKQLFQDFFEELQSYKPDYSDTHNHKLYWKLENAKPIYEEFRNILEKYRERNQSELKQRKADKLRKELAELEKD